MQKELIMLLQCYWANYRVDSFENNKILNILKEEEFREFIINLTHKVISFLKLRIMTLHMLENFINLLEVWQHITKFMGICCTFKIKDTKD